MSERATGRKTAARKATARKPTRRRSTDPSPPPEVAQERDLEERSIPFSTVSIMRVVFAVAGALLLLYSLYILRSVLVLVFVAAFLAVGIDPAVSKLEARGLKRGAAVALIIAGIVVFIVGFFAAVVPPLVTQVTSFATDLPEYVQDIAESNPRIRDYVRDNDVAEKLREATEDAPAKIAGSIGGVLGVAGSVLSSIFRVVTIIVLTIYFSSSLARIREGGLMLVPRSKRARVKELLDPILEKIGGYIAGNIIISLIAGSLAFIFLTIAGVPFPVALALWVAIADLLPLVGATLGAIPAVIVAFFVSAPVGLAALVYFVLYQQVENYLIAPRVMTKAVDLSPAAVLLAALSGAALLGFVGALMAIPAAAAVKLIVYEVVHPHVEES
ncbi:MAG TPA: AI-2E family transporter [Actinomycetota bacterium]|nr:AI-2E family transporter [Actinomycetota bacterium]